MNTDQLIDFLARGVEPADRPRWKRRFVLSVGIGLTIAIALVGLGLGFRPDIGAAIAPILMKAGFSAFTAAMALPVMLQLAKPGRALGWRIGAAAVFVALCAIITAMALWGEAPANRLRAWTGGGIPWCIVFIPLLAAPTAIGLLRLMRLFAPTRLTLAGAAVGAFSGGVGAVAYAMYCPVDSVAFVTTWYVLAIALCAAAGALLGARLLRW